MRTGDHRVVLASYLEMMLGALIKWRLPFPGERAARQKMPVSPVTDEKLSNFATLAIPTSAIAIVCVLFKDDVQQVSAFISIFYFHHLDLCNISFFFFN